MLSYGDFFKEVQRTRYDVELLSNIFGTTYETVAHRLCNLSRPEAHGAALPLPARRTSPGTSPSATAARA